jgi:ATP adenylyltransferase
MKRIWAPWRIDYIRSEKAPGCIFCDMLPETDDKKVLVLERNQFSFVVMNKYPYNNGHLMVAPYEHTNDLASLKPEVYSEMFASVQKCTRVLKTEMNPHGFNIGLNLGLVAGAGVEDHLHFHVVPRWNGDTNFMPVLADCRVISEHLDESYDILKKQFDQIDRG